MSEVWMDGATRVPGPHAGGLYMNGQNDIHRVTWHITWDVVDPRPPFGNVMNYLVSKGYEPTLGWNPETGEILQFMPADTGAYALEMKGIETNRMGAVNVQIEVYFSPGVGDNWQSFTDTPLLGAGKIVAFLDQLGIPRSGPMVDGDYSRDTNRWANESGHFGHVNAPLNSHTDPAYPPDMAKLFRVADQQNNTTPVPIPDPPATPQPDPNEEASWLILTPH